MTPPPSRRIQPLTSSDNNMPGEVERVKSIAERLPATFNFTFKGGEADSILHVSGSISTRDELDAVVTTLTVMQGWLRPTAALTQQEKTDAE